MKKIQLQEALRNIRRFRVSFLSIIIIAMIAVTAYLGITFAAEGLRRSTDLAFSANNTQDIEVISTTLITEEDLEQLAAVEGVGEVEGFLSIPTRVRNQDSYWDVDLRTATERIGRPTFVEGRAPETGTECAVERFLAEEMGCRVGDELTFYARNSVTDMLIRSKTCTVTGFFTVADHCVERYTVSNAVLVTRDAFQTVFLPSGVCTRAMLRFRETGLDRFSQEWQDLAAEIEERVKPLDENWVTLTLNNNTSYIGTQNYYNMLTRISLTFSLLFILIAAMVIYSTIGRLVEQDTRLIGAMKAVGLYNREIIGKFLIFGLGGTLVGTILGILAATFAIGPLLVFFFSISVIKLPQTVRVMMPLPTCIIVAGAAVLAVLAVLLACRHVMRASAVSMMNGQSSMRRMRTQAGRGNGKGLYRRLIFRNIRSDWQRVLVSILSIAGSCVLIMVGLIMRFSFTRVPDRQYGYLEQYQYMAETDPILYPEGMEEIGARLAEAGTDSMSVSRHSVLFDTGSRTGSVLLTATDSERLPEFLRLVDNYTGAAISLPEEGVLLGRWFHEELGLNVGDTLTLYDDQMEAHTVTIAGFMENHVLSPVLGRKSCLEPLFGDFLQENVWLVKLNGADPEALGQRLQELPSCLSFHSNQTMKKIFDVFAIILDSVILLLTALAVVIACFILMNLINTYIADKKTELIIMRINGYTTKETIRYAALESYTSLALGVVLGLVIGHFLGDYMVRQIEQQNVAMILTPYAPAYLGAAALTVIIVLVVQWFSFRKVRDMKLSDLQQ